MSKENYRKYLLDRVIQLETKMSRARRTMAKGTGHEKVKAAGLLALLEKDQAAVREKLEKLEQEPDSVWEDVKATIEEEVDMLESAVENLFAPH